MSAIYIEARDVPDWIKRAVGYSGRKWSWETNETPHIGSRCWSEGSRDTYVWLDLATRDTRQAPMGAPWEEVTGPVRLGSTEILAVHTIFRGKDLGVVLYVHPDSAPRLLSAPPEALPEIATTVLRAYQYKASYGGRSRAEMAGIDAAEYATGLAILQARGLVNKGKALTPSGKTAYAALRR